jgi:hypothetical protein
MRLPSPRIVFLVVLAGVALYIILLAVGNDS